MSSQPETTGNNNVHLMKIGAAANVKTSAGSIAHAVRRGDLPTIIAAKPASINQAVKALSIARGFLSNDQLDLVVVGNLRDAMDKKRVTLRAFKAEISTSPSTEQTTDLRASQSTQPTTLSGAIAKKVRAGEYPRVLCIGAEAVAIATIAAIQARRFLVADNIKIGFKPEFVHVKVEGAEDKSAICLSIVKTDN